MLSAILSVIFEYVGVFEEISFDPGDVYVYLMMGVIIPRQALCAPNVNSIVMCGLSDLLIPDNVSFR